MIRITKFHLLLLGIVVLIAGIFFYQVRIENQRRQEQAALESQRKAEARRREAERERQEALAKLERTAAQAVAVAGEYMLIAKREGRDLTRGQAILREAKEELRGRNFENAVALARQAIADFKEAPLVERIYTVRRGDNLWNIARQPEVYGRGARWVKIWRANEPSIPDFDVIYPDMRLLIPRLDMPSTPASR